MMGKLVKFFTCRAANGNYIKELQKIEEEYAEWTAMLKKKKTFKEISREDIIINTSSSYDPRMGMATVFTMTVFYEKT